ncbi:MAG: AI-2E family transporter [bacterium]
MQNNQSNTQKNNQAQSLQKKKVEQFSRYFLLIALLIIMVVFYNMIKIFLVPIVLAAVFSALFYPFYRWLLKLFRNNKSISAIVCCLVLLMGLLVPAYIVADLVSREAIALYQTAEAQIREIVEKGDAGLLGKIKNYEWVERLSLNKINWQSSAQQAAETAGTILAAVINKTSKGTFQFLTNLFITLFTMFYFFRDGERLIERIKYLSPLDDLYEEALIYRFVSVSRATIRGTLLIGLIQGGLGGFILWAFGIGSPILWGVVMVILSIIPMVGAWLILYPAAIIQIIIGNVWQGIAIFLITTVVIGNVDNLLRPRLVGRSASMHDLIVFFSTIGGIYMFGVMGFIIGPVIAVLFLTILDIYSVEFKQELDLAQNFDLAKEEEMSIPSENRPKNN